VYASVSAIISVFNVAPEEKKRGDFFGALYNFNKGTMRPITSVLFANM
jgi:hypothetical protein